MTVFARADAESQYFEVIANHGIYHDGWMANTAPKRLPWVGIGDVHKVVVELKPA